MERYWKRNMRVAWLGLFVNHMGFTLSVPFYPLFLQHDLGVQQGLTIWAGVSISISFLISGLCAPFWGSLADKYGSKPMLVRSGIGLGLVHLANFFVYDLTTFIIVRIIQGVMAGFSPATVALVGANTPEKHVGYALGVISTAGAAGGILGPLAGGLLIQFVGLRGCFIASGIITLLTAVIMLVGVKEVHEKPSCKRPSVLQDLRQAATTPGLLRLYGLLLLVSTSVMILEPLLTLLVMQLGGSIDKAALSSGIVFSAVGAATVLMGPRWGRLGGRIGYVNVLLIGLIGGGIGNLLQMAVNNLYSFGGLRFAYGLFFAAVYPALHAMIVQYADRGFRARAVALSQSAQQFGIVVGPLLGGLLGGLVGIPFVFALTGVALLLAAWSLRTLPSPQSTSPQSVETASTHR